MSPGDPRFPQKVDSLKPENEFALYSTLICTVRYGTAGCSLLYAVTTGIDRDVKAKLSELGKVILLEQEGPMRSYLYDRPTLIFQSWE